MTSPPHPSQTRAPDAIAIGLGLLRTGRPAEAAALFHRVLAEAPGSRDAMNGLGLALAAQGAAAEGLPWLERAIGDGGVPASWHANHAAILRQVGRDAEAVEALHAAVGRDARNPAFRLQLGDALLALRDFAGARDAYRLVVEAAPDLVVAWNNLGNALDGLGDAEGAIDAYGAAAARNAGVPETWVNLGNSMIRVGRPEEALAAFERAAALRPGFAPAENGRGNALHQLARSGEALAALDRAVAADPADGNAHNNRGIVLQSLGRLEEAAASFERAIALAPLDPAPRNNLGNALQHLGRTADAIASYRAALALRPAYPEALSNLGNALEADGAVDEAVASYRAALAVRPDFARAFDNLGNLLQTLGRHEEAEATFDAALALRPDYLPTRLHGAMARLRIVYRDAAERDASRAAYARDLAALADMPLPRSAGELTEAAEALGANQPFYLAYQGENDRELQRIYGGLACRIMAARHPQFAAAPARPGLTPGERIRVGVLSGFFRPHSNWKVPIRSWLEDLDPGEFALHGYYTQAVQTPETERARTLCARFLEGRRPIEAWAEAIRADRLHVLLIPEIGMDPVTVRLAALRLAPVQATSWGHPQTSGMPTIDDFLSSELMEPPDGDAHYTERLVRLPGLSFRHLPGTVVPEAVSRGELAVEDDAVVYWCCQSLYKYLPQFDDVFARIAAEVPSARFLFIGYPLGNRVSETFRARLAASFARAGLAMERHCRFLGTLTPQRFAGVSRLADVFLDSIGWSGCNSTLEALDFDVPVVTLPGALMRARHSAALLERVGIRDTIATDIDAYVAIAVRLGRDAGWRTAISRRIAAGKAALSDDPAAAAGLARYLRAAAGRAPPDAGAIERARAHRRGGRLGAAIAVLEGAVRHAPGDGEALAELGATLWAAGRATAAIDALRRAAALRPDDVAGQGGLAAALYATGDHEAADAAFAAALALAPGHFPTRLHAAIARLRIVYPDVASRERSRAAYARDLAALAAAPLPTSPSALAEAADAVGSMQPFYLAYQGHADRDLQAIYGDLVCRVMAARHPRLAAPPPFPGLAPGERIRVGIVSGFFRHHSNWKMRLRGWLEDLDPARFAVHCYFTGMRPDAETARARSLCARFVEGQRSLGAWGQAIRDDRLHVLLFPEIGMDPVTVRLAALRLAPVQAASWGHPQTSGMPTIDDFLSSDAMEPPGAEAHYTERLVRLAGLSCRPVAVPLEPEPVTRDEIGVEAEDVLYWCSQQLQKYLPEHDHVFARIAAGVPRSRFLFIAHVGGERVTAVFRARLAAVFAAAGLAMERHCVFLPTMAPARYAGFERVVDVFLDSIGWSGCNSTLEALDRGLPVVTVAGAVMRARHSAGILSCMGLGDMIAPGIDAYVDLAIALGRDPERRRAFARRIPAARPLVREDRRPAAGLAAYLEEAAVGGTVLVPRARAARLDGRVDEAIGMLEERVRQRPADGLALAELGAALWSARRHTAAIEALRRAVAALPDRIAVRNSLANALHVVGDHDGAEAEFARTLALAPAHLPTRLNAAVARLRPIYRDAAERDRARSAYGHDLAALVELPLPAERDALARIMDARKPFHLAAQGGNDSDLQGLYGRFVCRVMAARFPEFSVSPPRPGTAAGGRIRVGILSGFFRRHSNWKMRLHGWLEDLDPTRFALHGYFTGGPADAATARARALCAKFVEGRRPVSEWAAAIRRDRLHVLLIPEIGMDPTTLQLAALRLAPVQATSWGHPQTSGMPTIDDFLSSDAMEPADAEAWYTERLVRLPGLSCRPVPVAVAPAVPTRAALGVGEEDVLYWCCQQLHKYLPEHDHVFARIAAAEPRARFLFVGTTGGEGVEAVFRGRLATAFAAGGLDADHHCRYLGVLSAERFAGVTSAADIFLDSIAWSGCNSTLEALAADLPVVTWPGRAMRARHSAAILRRIGMEDTIANSEAEYIAIAAALGRDRGRRTALRRRIAAGKGALSSDRSYLAAMEDYLTRAAAGAR